MHVDAGDRDTWQLRRAGIDRTRLCDRNAELVFRLAGRNLGVRAGIDIWIDADRDARRASRFGRKPRQQIEFGFGFDVDAENVCGQSRAQLGFGLADAGEQDLARPECPPRARASVHRRTPRPRRRRASPAFAAPTDWSSPSWHSRPAIFTSGEGVGEHAVVPLQRRRRITIERRADASASTARSTPSAWSTPSR